ncbi:MAG: glycine cleavage T C-terminal barrel domain-containing protein, partial [Pseudomonadota bacterium]
RSQGCKTWGMDGIDPHFSNDLSPNDPDRVIDVLENVFERMPCLTETGIHTIVNGPITYSPDGLPLVGAIPGKRNAFCIIGLRAGVGEGGGHGKILAETIVHGQAEWDAWALDPRRFGDHATTEFTAAKAIEEYQNEFRFHMPHEHRPAGRPARVTPVTEALRAEGATFGVVNGWERASFYKPTPDFVEDHSFHRTKTEDVVAAEVAHVRDQVGIMEVNGFNRIEIAGEGAWAWLNGLLTNPPPRKVGKVSLNYFLAENGAVLGEATLARLAEDRFWWGSAAAAEKHDWDWLMARKPDGVTLTQRVETHNIFVVAGPKSRDVLQAASPRSDWSKEGFPWLSVREVCIGHTPAVAMSVSFSGELAWELHVPMSGSLAAWRALREAGAAFEMKPFGLYATESMRLEKGYRHWKADLIDERDPYETGLDRFVRMNGRDFPGKAALAARIADRRFIHLSIDGPDPAQPGTSIRADGEVVGTISSAGIGHRTGLNIAMGFANLGDLGPLTVDVLGEARTATEITPCVYDPENARVRA